MATRRPAATRVQVSLLKFLNPNRDADKAGTAAKNHNSWTIALDLARDSSANPSPTKQRAVIATDLRSEFLLGLDVDEGLGELGQSQICRPLLVQGRLQKLGSVRHSEFFGPRSQRAVT
jgi:hypothetical protein